MRLLNVGSLTLAAAATFVIAGASNAQDSQFGLLNKLEVKQFVARGLTGDHTRLSTHFTVLKGQYQDEARRHASMARAGAWAKTAEIVQAQHCRLLTDRNTAQATTLSALAIHHARLAEGLDSTAPEGSAPFEAGLGATDPRPESVAIAAQAAFTSSDHEVLSDYFANLAVRYANESAEHAANARAWRGIVARVPAAAHTADRCERLAAELGELATDAEATARAHRSLVNAIR